MQGDEQPRSVPARPPINLAEQNPEIHVSDMPPRDQFRDPTIVETLAISHAAAGDFKSAIEKIQQAKSMTNNPEKIRLLTEVLDKFERGEKFQ